MVKVSTARLMVGPNEREATMRKTRLIALATSSLAALAVAALGVLPSTSQAVPSMGRQTGMQCNACHTVFPELTPFGRQFKLRGFSMSMPKTRPAEKNPSLDPFGTLPISGLLQVSRTSTSNTSTPGAEPEQFENNRDVVAQGAGLYYGGRITDKSGALVQYFYEGAERKWMMEMFDVRYADSGSFAGQDAVYGFTLSNNPTVTDPYNSVPQWRFPHVDALGVPPNASLLAENGFASQVGGPGVYALWNNTLYTEVALYSKARNSILRPLSAGAEFENLVKGVMPYWRLALQRETGAHSFSLGTFGLSGKLYADAEDLSLGTNRFRSLAFDGQYQFIAGEHVVSLQALRINEKQKQDASFAAGLVSNEEDTLRATRVNAHYWWRRQWGGGVGLFSTTGTQNPLRYDNGEPVHGSVNASPNTSGWMLDLNYLPWQNVKLTARYTAYTKFNGAKNDYDGFGRNASDNNNLYLLAWFMF